MDLNIPRIIVTGITIFIVLMILNKSGWLENASPAKRAVFTIIAIFVPLFVINLIWF